MSSNESKKLCPCNKDFKIQKMEEKYEKSSLKKFESYLNACVHSKNIKVYYEIIIIK